MTCSHYYIFRSYINGNINIKIRTQKHKNTKNKML